MRRIGTRALVAGMVALGTLGAGASTASATNSDPHKITICHATASKTNPYVVINVDIASIIGDSGHGHSGVNAGDIIPPIIVDAIQLYGGNNWPAGQATFYNGCNVPSNTADGSGYPSA